MASANTAGPPGSNVIPGPTGKPKPCEYRDRCLVEVTRDGVELQVPRSTWGVPCFHEVVGDLISCTERAVFIRNAHLAKTAASLTKFLR